MLKCYTVEKKALEPISVAQAPNRIGDLVWVDLLEPTSEEEYFVEHLLGIGIPTRDEMHEIELSSRLYQKEGSIYATATVVTKSTTPEPETHAITFVLTSQCLITIRYSDPQPFKVFLARSSGLTATIHHGNTVLTGLLEAIIDRMADILEMVGHNIDGMGRKIFRPRLESHNPNPNADDKPDFEEMLRLIGSNGDLVSKTRESMVSISRLLGFISHTTYFPAGSEENTKVHTILRDIQALSDHASFLSNKVNFLLDATLGMISIEQNAIIKIFSVAAVVFLPPTLVASIYGMNFDEIPELHWHLGYPLAIVLMILSALLPYKFFRSKGWL